MDHVTHLGLDVHKDKIAVAILRPDQNVPVERVIPNTREALLGLVARRRGTDRLLRGRPDRLRDAPAPKLPRRSTSSLQPWSPRLAGTRVKTDRLNAQNLARLYRAGELTSIRVPTPKEEALRDLLRVREDLKDDRRKTMHRLKSFMVRQGRRHPGRAGGWTGKFDLWVRGQGFAEPATSAVFRHYLAAWTPGGHNCEPSTPRS